MRTYSKDTIPWRLRTEAPTAAGALTPKQMAKLCQEHDLDPAAVAELSRSLNGALSAELHLRQIELMPQQDKKGAAEVRVAIKALQSAEKKLTQAAEVIGQLRFKNPYSHTGMPNPSGQYLESFARASAAIDDFRTYLEIMAREESVSFTGHPDKRKISDLRRNMVCVAIFGLWTECGRSLTVTTHWATGERSGRLIDFVNAVTECITDPPERLDDDAIRREIDAFKSELTSD